NQAYVRRRQFRNDRKQHSVFNFSRAAIKPTTEIRVAGYANGNWEIRFADGGRARADRPWLGFSRRIRLEPVRRHAGTQVVAGGSRGRNSRATPYGGWPGQGRVATGRGMVWVCGAGRHRRGATVVDPSRSSWGECAVADCFREYRVAARSNSGAKPDCVVWHKHLEGFGPNAARVRIPRLVPGSVRSAYRLGCSRRTRAATGSAQCEASVVPVSVGLAS